MDITKLKHTPGPWFPVQYAGKFNIQTVDYYAESDVLDLEYSQNAEANAKLIAAAPELFDILIKIIDAKDKSVLTVDLFDVLQHINEAKKIIEKVTE